MAFERTESYMHLCAKEVLASWLRSYASNPESAFFIAGEDRIPAPWATNGVWLEYTFASSNYPDTIPFFCWENYFPPNDDSNSFPYEYVKSQNLSANLKSGVDWSDCVVADISIKPNRALLHSHDVWGSWGWLHNVPNIHHDCCFVFEVVHKHPVSQEKLDTYRRCGVLAVYEVSASWILSQTGVSNTIQCLNVYKLHGTKSSNSLKPAQIIPIIPHEESVPREDIDKLWSRLLTKVEGYIGISVLMQEHGELHSFDRKSCHILIDSYKLLNYFYWNIKPVENALSDIFNRPVSVFADVNPSPRNQGKANSFTMLPPPPYPHKRMPNFPAISCPPKPSKDVPF